MYVIAKQNGEMNHATKDYLCDTQEDMNAIPTSDYTMGSTCYIIKEGTQYMSDGDKKWQLVRNDGGSAGNEGVTADEVSNMIDTAFKSLQLTATEENMAMTLGLTTKEG